MPMFDRNAGEKVYQTVDKQWAVKDQLTNVLFDVIRGFKDILVSADSGDPFGDPRFDALTLFLTTFAVDVDDSAKLILLRRELIAQRINANTMTPKEQNREMFNINIEIIARCQSEFDKFYGIKKKQEIMRVDSPGIKKSKEKYGDDVLGLMFAGKPLDKGVESQNEESKR